jgi:hypothetical protein
MAVVGNGRSGMETTVRHRVAPAADPAADLHGLTAHLAALSPTGGRFRVQVITPHGSSRGDYHVECAVNYGKLTVTYWGPNGSACWRVERYARHGTALRLDVSRRSEPSTDSSSSPPRMKPRTKPRRIPFPRLIRPGGKLASERGSTETSRPVCASPACASGGIRRRWQAGRRSMATRSGWSSQQPGRQRCAGFWETPCTHSTRCRPQPISGCCCRQTAGWSCCRFCPCCTCRR